MSRPRRQTFNEQDPVMRNIPASPTGLTRASRRRLENISDESSTSGSSISTGLSHLSVSSTSSPVSASTSITEPDMIEVPVDLESRVTLEWLGLGRSRAQELWQKWESIHQNMEKFTRENLEDFGTWARGFLRHIVADEELDVYEPNEDWVQGLRKIGASENVARQIGTCPPELERMRLTRSAVDWLDVCLDYNWHWLLHVNRASNIRAAGTLSPVQVRMVSVEGQNEDVTLYGWDRKTNNITHPTAKPDFLVFWRGTSISKAESLYEGPCPTGEFKLKSQLCATPTDFSLRPAQYWTPDLEAAQQYATFAKRFVKGDDACLIRIEVPKKIFRDLKLDPFPFTLHSEMEEWKRLVWYCRRSEDIEPTSLEKKHSGSAFLVGDIASGNSAKYAKLKDWTEVNRDFTYTLNNGEPATQFVFQHCAKSKPLLDEINKLAHKTTFRHYARPNEILSSGARQDAKPPKA